MFRLLAPLLAALLLLGASPAHANDARELAIPASNEPAHPSTFPSSKITLEEWKKLPDKVRYSPGSAIPYGYEHRRTIRKAPMIVGASIFGGTYFFSTLGATADRTLYPLMIPVVGPWISLLTAGPYIDPSAAWLLTWDGIAQATGLGLFLWGVTSKQDWLIKRPYGFASLQVMPTFANDRAGALVVGTFR